MNSPLCYRIIVATQCKAQWICWHSFYNPEKMQTFYQCHSQRMFFVPQMWTELWGSTEQCVNLLFSRIRKHWCPGEWSDLNLMSMQSWKHECTDLFQKPVWQKTVIKYLERNAGHHEPSLAGSAKGFEW